MVAYSHPRRFPRGGLPAAVRTALLVLLIAGLLPAASPATAATIVGGVIDSDTVWTLAQAPYIVASDVQVIGGVKLTIAPGVSVRFQPGRRLQVDGTLIARGTASQLVLFTSERAGPAAGDWAGIYLTASSAPATFDAAGHYVAGSILQYCTVEYAGAGLESAVHAPAAAPFLDHCRIRNNAARGLRVMGSADRLARVTNNTISANASALGGGVYARYAVLENNQVTENTGSRGAGIYAEHGVLRDNLVAANVGTSRFVYGVGIYATGSEVISNTVRGNTFSFTSQEASYSYGGGIFGGSVIAGNLVEDNELRAVYSGSGDEIQQGGGIWAWGTISGNVVRRNSVVSFGRNRGGGIYATGVISGNNVQNNYAGSGAGIYGADATVTNNFVAGNSAGGLGVAGCMTRGGAGGGIYGLHSNISHNVVISNTAGDQAGGILADYGLATYNLVMGNAACDIATGIASSGVVMSNTVIFNHGLQADWGVGAVRGTWPWYEQRAGDWPAYSNNIYGNQPYNADSEPPIPDVGRWPIDARYNYWGSTNRDEIASHLHGQVAFEPYLLELAPDAPVPPPANLQAARLGRGVTLAWDAIPASTTYAYRVYYSTSADRPPYTGSGLAQGDSPVNAGATTAISLTGLSANTTYYFAVTATDTAGRESWYGQEAVAAPVP